MKEKYLPHIIVIDNLSQELERIILLLKNNNYRVNQFDDVQKAYDFCLTDPPDLIVIQSEFKEGKSLQFFRQIKSHFITQSTPVIFVSSESSIDQRIELIEMGIDDFILKPYYPEEIFARIETILQECEVSPQVAKKEERGFIGHLREMNLIDLIQTLEIGKKSGVIHLNRGDKEGQVYVKNGKIVDAIVDGYNSSERAFLHMLTWLEGTFYVRIMNIDKNSASPMDDYKLLNEGAKLIGLWKKATADLPSLQTPLFAINPENPKEVSQDEKIVLDYFKKPHTILRAIDALDFDDFYILQIIKSLLEKGVLIKTETTWEQAEDHSGLFLSQYKKEKSINKNKYAQILSLFKFKNNKDKGKASIGDISDNGNEKVPSSEKVSNAICLSRAELLLIRQKFSN